VLAKIEKLEAKIFQATAINPVKSRCIDDRTPLKAELVRETSIDLSDFIPIKANIPM
jgi:hypothetical protein